MFDDLSQFKQTYISECFELLGQMEELLLNLDQQADSETLNAIFRCAHSIKGGAGAFGLSEIAKFSHVLEALLDKLRDKEIGVTPELTNLLLQSKDVLQDMVECARSGENKSPEQAASMLELLKNATNSSDQNQLIATIQNVSALPEEESPNINALMVSWQIVLKPKPNIFLTGNEPLRLIKELHELGSMTARCHVEAIPKLEQLEAEKCYVWWELSIETDADEARLKEVFEFVDDAAEVTIQKHIDVPCNIPDGNETMGNDASAIADTKNNQPVNFGRRQEDRVAGGNDVKSSATTSIRVDTEKVDKLINMVGEMVIVQSMLAMQSRFLNVKDHATMMQGIEDLSQQTRELQEAVMSIRMQPLKSIFSRMPRIVRDVSAKLGKQVILSTQGEHTEVDKTIIEQLSDPLTHMIRNAIDHGIEMPEERKELGKNAEGTITLSAEHRSSNIIISIVDDGHGINRKRVKEKAIERGIIAPDQPMSDEAIDQLVFAPGFSTAEAVTDVSGRGVGMDVVKRNIEAVGGKVHLKSTTGKGTHITITLPLTLAILDGMVVKVGAEQYIVPINHIIETLRPDIEHIRSLPSGQSIIQIRGEIVPLISLAEMFDIHGAETNIGQSLVILVENQHKVMGLVVDELIGQQQVVIKTLSQNSSHIHGIFGATILGDGRVSLILDVGALQPTASPYSESTIKIVEAA